MSYAVGDAIAPFTIESVSADAMKNWAVFLADPNPIHLDVEVVKAKGLGDRVINQGPINVAYMMNMLLAAFPEISSAIIFIADGIAERIDNVNGLDNFLRMAQEKALGFTFARNVLLLSIPDLIIALLAFVSYLILYIARYLTIAMYHFYCTSSFRPTLRFETLLP